MRGRRGLVLFICLEENCIDACLPALKRRKTGTSLLFFAPLPQNPQQQAEGISLELVGEFRPGARGAPRHDLFTHSTFRRLPFKPPVKSDTQRLKDSETKSGVSLLRTAGTSTVHYRSKRLGIQIPRDARGNAALRKRFRYGLFGRLATIFRRAKMAQCSEAARERPLPQGRKNTSVLTMASRSSVTEINHVFAVPGGTGAITRDP